MLDFDLTPVLSNLIVGELASLRKISTLDPVFQGLGATTEIGRGELGTDSVDLLTLAGAVAEMFHLHETGVEEYLLRYRTLENWCEIVAISLNKQAALNKDAERITFRTSGSTGTPKRCVHSLHKLVEEAAEHAASLVGCRRVFSMVPCHHIYGFLWTILVPAQLETGKSVERVDARGWSPTRISAEARPGDLLVGVPSQWGLIARSFDSLPSGTLGVTSGAACSRDLFDRVVGMGVDLVEVYGSSETGGIGTRRGGAEPFRLLSFLERELVQAPDQLVWEDQRRFRVGPRHDGAVQIAGKNVFPEQVAAVLRSHPGVNDCRVRTMQSGDGSRLKFFVVPAMGVDCSTEDLRKWLQSRLQPHEQPAAITFGDQLPVNEIGKASDWQVEGCGGGDWKAA